MTGNEKKRVRAARALLPQIIATAIRIHGSGPKARSAALAAWANLAGVIGWTPEMVDKLDALMEEHA